MLLHSIWLQKVRNLWKWALLKSQSELAWWAKYKLQTLLTRSRILEKVSHASAVWDGGRTCRHLAFPNVMAWHKCYLFRTEKQVRHALQCFVTNHSIRRQVGSRYRSFWREWFSYHYLSQETGARFLSNLKDAKSDYAQWPYFHFIRTMSLLVFLAVLVSGISCKQHEETHHVSYPHPAKKFNIVTQSGKDVTVMKAVNCMSVQHFIVTVSGLDPEVFSHVLPRSLIHWMEMESAFFLILFLEGKHETCCANTT